MRRSLTPTQPYFCLLPGLSSIGTYIAMLRAVVGTRPLLTIVHQPHPLLKECTTMTEENEPELLGVAVGPRFTVATA